MSVEVTQLSESDSSEDRTRLPRLESRTRMIVPHFPTFSLPQLDLTHMFKALSS